MDLPASRDEKSFPVKSFDIYETRVHFITRIAACVLRERFIALWVLQAVL